MKTLVKSSRGIDQISLETQFFSEHRTVFIEGEIDSASALEFTKQILYLNQIGQAPIQIYINSAGGEVNAGLLMVDVVTGSKAPIKMYCIGRAYSMAALLFATGKERYMLPNSELMLHQPLLRGQVNGDAVSIQSVSESLTATRDKFLRLLAQFMGKSAAELEEATRFDHYFSPDDAVAFNLADKVITFTELLER